jgi:hypothetical protein
MIVDDRDRSSTDGLACLGARSVARLPTPDQSGVDLSI